MESKKLTEPYKKICLDMGKKGVEAIQPYVERFKKLDELTPIGSGFYIIVNLITTLYEYLGRNQEIVTSFSNKRVKREGVEFLSRHIHPEDGEYIIKIGYPKFKNLLDEAGDDKYNLMMQCNYRFRHKDGHYIHLVEQNQLMDIAKGENQHYLLAYICEIPMIEPFKGNILFKKMNQKGKGYKNICLQNYPEPMPMPEISQRELDIVRLISKGNNNAEIGEKLFISPHTVKTHRKNILRKMDKRSMNKVVASVIVKGWL